MKQILEGEGTENFLQILGERETIDREAQEAEATMRRLLQLPPELTWLEGLRNFLGASALEKARRESARVRGASARAAADRLARRARELGAITSDDRLAWPLRRLTAELNIVGERSARGHRLTPAGVRQALILAGIRSAPPASTVPRP